MGIREWCPSSRLGDATQNFNVAVATSLRDALYFRGIISKRDYIDMRYSIRQRKHSYFMPKLKFWKLNTVDTLALTIYNEAQHWVTLIWGYYVSIEEANALTPKITAAAHRFKNVRNFGSWNCWKSKHRNDQKTVFREIMVFMPCLPLGPGEIQSHAHQDHSMIPMRWKEILNVWIRTNIN